MHINIYMDLYLAKSRSLNAVLNLAEGLHDGRPNMDELGALGLDPLEPLWNDALTLPSTA